MWNLKCDTNEPIQNTETDSQAVENRTVVLGWGWQGGRIRSRGLAGVN